MKNWIARAAAAALLGFAACAPAWADSGQDAFDRLPAAQPLDVQGKVVVTEFFWYNCPHCAEFEPEVEAWARKLPADVVFERVPVAFAPQFADQQKFYYALKTLGKVDALQQPIFEAIHVQHIPLQNVGQMGSWVEAHGVPRKQFLDAFNSFGVQMAAQRATQMVNDYQIDGVPTLVVQGLYKLSAGKPATPTNAAVLAEADKLIAMERRTLHTGAKN